MIRLPTVIRRVGSCPARHRIVSSGDSVGLTSVPSQVAGRSRIVFFG